MPEAIRATSFSRLKVYEQCGLRAKLAFIDRVKELQADLPPGEELPNERGTRVHQQADAYVREGGTLIPELSSFAAEFKKLHELYAKDQVETEQMWLFDKAWTRLPDDDPFSRKIWLRVKCDAVVWQNDSELVVIDFKTGRRFGNEVEHATQCQLYQLGAFLRYPGVKTVTTELWYVDQDELVPIQFTRKQGLRFFETWNERMIRMTSDTDLIAKPNVHSCRWCPYKTGQVRKGVQGTGHCDLNPE